MPNGKLKGTSENGGDMRNLKGDSVRTELKGRKGRTRITLWRIFVN